MFQNSSIQFDLLKRRAFNLRWATVAEGVIPLTAADPDFPCASEISEAISRFVKDGYYCYGPPEGMVEFKQALASFFVTKRNVAVNPDFVLPLNSAANGIYITCESFLDKGDQAIIFDPVDFLFRYSIESVGAEAIPFSIPPGIQKVDFSSLEELITPKTKMICLCNPLNPTGKVFSKEELFELGMIACKYDLIILSDEIWSDIVFQPAIFTSIASINDEIRERTITITGFSKSYGLAGLRIGAVISHNKKHFEVLMDASMHNSTIQGVSILSQIAATAALTSCDEWLKSFVEHLSAMKTLLVHELNSIPGFKCIAPEGCYLAFIDITETGKTSQEIHDLLLNEAKVAVVPGLKQWFGNGAEGYIRMSFATSEVVLLEAISRIKKVLV
jgi:aminotransferase